MMSEAQPVSHEPESNGELIEGVRNLLDWLVRNAEFKGTCINITVFPNSKKELSELARNLGSTTKDYNSSAWLFVHHEFGPRVVLTIAADRSLVCKKIITGTKIIPAHMVEEETVETFEWECNKSILAPDEI